MNTGHDGSMGTLHANSPREALSRLESMITMGGFTLPSKTIREMIAELDRRHHPGRAPARRLAPHHPHHRGGRHRRRRHHHPGPLRLRDHRRGRRTAASSAGIARPASAGRGSGTAPATSTRRCASPPRSTPPTREEPDRRASRCADVRLAVIAASPIVGLAMLSAGGLAYALLYGRIQDENTRRAAARAVRRARRRSRPHARRARPPIAAKRRKSVQETLKEIEEKQKAQGQAAASRRRCSCACSRPGCNWSRRTFLHHQPRLRRGRASSSPGSLGAPLYVAAGLRRRRRCSACRAGSSTSCASAA